MSTSDKSKVVIPGDILFLSSNNRRPGKGTYELHGSIYSSLAGFVYIKEEKQSDNSIEVVEVRSSEVGHEHVVPFIGSVVTARVSSIGQRFAKCSLLCVENTPLQASSEFVAILRREDIAARDKDKIDLPKCVSPGDVILARIISYGDNQTSFLLSTAEDELGVISGVGEDGERMQPIDWETVQGVKSLTKGKRKVAQIPKLNSLFEDDSTSVTSV